MKKISTLALLSLLSLGLTGCEGDNKLKFVRDASTPMTVEFNNLDVIVYKQHEEMRQDPSCGSTWVGNNPVWNTCPVMVVEEDRHEKISVVLEFPAGSELKAGKKEEFVGELTNDWDHPELNYGTLTIKVKKSQNDYDKDALKNITAYYNQVTTVRLSLK